MTFERGQPHQAIETAVHDMKPRYAPGQEIEVVDRVHPGHMRTPTYVRGKPGTVIRVVGPMLNPEQLAYGYSGVPGKMLYRIRFRQRDLWPNYSGSEHDSLEIEIYEHWLAPRKDQTR